MPFRRFEGLSPGARRRFNQLRPTATRWESMQSSFSLTDTVGGNLIDRYNAPSRDTGEMLDPDQANELFPDLEEPFNRPVSRQFAEYAAERNSEKQALQNIVKMGPQDASQTLLNLGSSMGATMVDPAELAITVAAFASGVGALRLAGFARGATKGAQVARIAAGNLAASATIEPILYNDAKYFQEERTAGEVFTSIAANAVLGTAMDVGGEALMRAFSRRQGLDQDLGSALLASEMGKDPGTVMKNMGEARPQLEFQGYGAPTDFPRIDGPAGPRPDQPGPRGFGPNDPGPRGRDASFTLDDFPYTFREIQNGGVGQKFFTVTNKRRSKLKSGRTPLMGTMLDQGVHITDSPKNAVGYVDSGNISSPDGAVGSLREVLLQDGNIVDGDIAFKNASRDIQKLISSLGKDQPEMTLSQALRETKLKDAGKVQDNVLRIMKEEKIDGFHFKDTVDGESFNNVFLRDSATVTEQRAYKVKRKKSDPQYDSNMQKFKEDLASEKTDFGYDEATAQTARETSPEFKDEINSDIQRDINEVQGQYDRVKAREDFSPMAREIADEADALDAELESMPEVLREAAFCIRG